MSSPGVSGRRRNRADRDSDSNRRNNNNNNDNNNNNNNNDEKQQSVGNTVNNSRNPGNNSNNNNNNNDSEMADRDVDGDNSGDDSEGSGEDLLDEDIVEEDYKAIPELDQYESEDIDNEEYDAMDFTSRAKAESKIAEREKEERRRSGRLPGALNDALDEIEDEQYELLQEDEPARRRRRIAAGGDENSEDEAYIDEAGVEEKIYADLENLTGPTKENLTKTNVRKEIIRRFEAFLRTYREDDTDNTGNIEPIYMDKILEIGRDNKSSLVVDYTHLSQGIGRIAILTADEPELMFELLNEAAYKLVKHMYPNYHNITKEINVRITNLPIVDSLRELRQTHLNTLVKVEGVVTRRTGVFPQLKIVHYNCVKCSTVIGPYTQQSSKEIDIGVCPECQSKGPFTINNAHTVYRNFQKITLQESPGSVPAGRIPRQKDIILLSDLIDSVSPGELVEVTGIYKHSYDFHLNTQHGFPVFATLIQANYVAKQSNSITSMRITDEDTRDILKYSKRPDISSVIFNSIAPSIYGHQNIKIAVALAMFGGEAKEFENGHRIRGDCNILILGDPGTAKSQFLKYVEKTAPRAIYTTGKGASAVGLTASVHRDPVTREWSLEGGALVLADRGVCLIDEFDKMNEKDRVSIHEAMEQQSISISKAGIITTLKARCSVIAAANPVSGRYNSSQTFSENVELSDAILSRFDCLCVVRDTVDVDTDTKLSSFVIDSHVNAHPAAAVTLREEEEKKEIQDGDNEMNGIHHTESINDSNTMSQDLLRKYIIYAREHCHPKLGDMDVDKIARLYADLRRESAITGGIPIAVRHIESMIRMAEAHAKIHLRENVIDVDINMAIRCMLESFISTQKFSVMRSLRKHFDKYLIFNRDTEELLLFQLQQLLNEQIRIKFLNRNADDIDNNEFSISQSGPIQIPMEEFQAKAAELQLDINLNQFFKSNKFANAGFTMEKNKKFITKRWD